MVVTFGSMSVGRYAPSPTGHLHLGNLRTAVIAWARARSTDGGFIVRIEDIDRQRSKREFEAQQLADLAAVGVEWDGTPVRQSERDGVYFGALEKLPTFECFCSRREIQDAASAPHGSDLAPGAYPGTCRHLSAEVRESKRAERAAKGMAPALRLAAEEKHWLSDDLIHGPTTGTVDDFVLKRADGDWAYNLAVVADDADQGVTEVVRGDDLLSSAPRQAYLAHLLGESAPTYFHVPLVVNSEGRRLAKRDGDVTLRDVTAESARKWIMASLGFPGLEIDKLPEVFTVASVPREPVVFS